MPATQTQSLMIDEGPSTQIANCRNASCTDSVMGIFTSLRRPVLVFCPGGKTVAHLSDHSGYSDQACLNNAFMLFSPL